MTLALYGKSRKRQGGLLLAALLAIIGAAVGGLMLIGTAFAHDAGANPKTTCNADGSWVVDWQLFNDWGTTATITKLTISAGVNTPSTLPTSIPPAAGNFVPPFGTVALQTSLSAATSSVTLTIEASWPDKVTAKHTITVKRTDGCSTIQINKYVQSETGWQGAAAGTWTFNIDGTAGTYHGQPNNTVIWVNRPINNKLANAYIITEPVPNNGYALVEIDNSFYGYCGNPDNAGTTSATVTDLPAIVCAYNKPTPPTPTVTKAIAQTATDATKAYWDITIDNTATGAIARSGIVIADAGASLDSASPASCTPATGSGNWTCSVTAGGKTVLHVSKLLSTATYPDGVCKPGSINNSVTSATMGQTTLTVTNPASAITLPAKADLSCLSFKKERLSDTSYKITIHNTGPATTVDVTDTFAPDGTTQTLASPAPAGCSLSNGNLTLTCTAYTVAANSDTTITVNTTAYTNSQVCQDQTVTNTAAITRGGSNVSVIPGASASASNTFKTTRTDCNNGNLVITKVKDPTTGVPVADSSMFNGTIDGAGDWKSGGIGFNQSTAPKSVSPGLHTVAETVTQNSWTPVGWALGNVDGCPAEKDAYSGGSNSQVSVATGQTTYACVMNTKQQEVSDRTLTVCKIVEDNGDGVDNSGTFGFSVGSATTSIDATEGAKDPKCETVRGVPTSVVTVSETLPTGWATADGYPKVKIGDGTESSSSSIDVEAGTSDVTVTFTNKAKPVTVNVTFGKYVCNAYSDVSINRGGDPNDVGSALSQMSQTAAPTGDTAVTPGNDGRGKNCDLVPWSFTITDNLHGGSSVPVNTTGATDGQGLPDDHYTLTPDQLAAAIAGGKSLVIKEEKQSGYGFASIKCYNDHRNQDNEEWLDFHGGIPTEPVYCLAYNVKLDKQITIEKNFLGVTDTTKDDVPRFFLDPEKGTSCGEPVKVNNTTWTVTCTVPWDWSGKVTESPSGGWKEVTCEESAPSNKEAIVAADSPYATFCNQAVGTVVVHKQITATQRADGTTFSGTINASSSLGWGPIQAGGSSTVSNVPAGSATLEENPSANGWSRSGSLYIIPAGAQLSCPTDPSSYTATTVTVTGGGTTHVCVLNDQAAQQVKRTLLVRKVIVGPNPDNNATFSGTVNPGTLNWSVKNGQVQKFLNLDTNVYTVTETPTTGYTTLGYKVYYSDDDSCPATTPSSYDGTSSAVVDLTPKEQTLGLVCVYNQPLVTINVHKTEQNGSVTSNGAGWSVTVSGCSTSKSAVTDANGNASFTNLPLCSSYTVSENINSKGGGTYTPASGYPTSVAVNATTAGQVYTVLFANVKFNNPCGDGGCTPSILQTPTPTPVTPTATPVTPTVTQPTKTATQPAEVTTPTPTQVDKVHGEKTPGANATPLAPSTGSGLFGSGKSGSNLLLAVLGIFSLSAGFAVIAVANKNKSRS